MEGMISNILEDLFRDFLVPQNILIIFSKIKIEICYFSVWDINQYIKNYRAYDSSDDSLNSELLSESLVSSLSIMADFFFTSVGS